MPKALQGLYDMKTYELEFPLRDPRFVIPDTDFEKERDRQLGVSSRLQYFLRQINRTFRLLIFGEKKRVVNGIKKRIGKNVEK